MLAVLHCVYRCSAQWWLLLVACALPVTALWRRRDVECFKVRDRVHQWKALTSFLLRFLTSITGSSEGEAIAPDFLLDMASFASDSLRGSRCGDCALRRIEVVKRVNARYSDGRRCAFDARNRSWLTYSTRLCWTRLCCSCESLHDTKSWSELGLA
jgi:hypothetical protein